jgi:predicted O-methyltransferase YrrM
MSNLADAVLDRLLRTKTKLADWIDGRRNRDPLVARPTATAEEFRRLFDEARSVAYPRMDALEEETGFAVDREWLDALALHTQIVKKRSKLAYPHGRLLYSLLRRYIADQGPRSITILETGTARGFSALCMAKAMADADVEGRIITLDVLPHNRPIYWNCIDDLEGRKSRRELLSPWDDLLERIVFLQGNSFDLVSKIGVSRINFAFLDAQHLNAAVLHEQAAVAALQQRGDMVVFDDVSPDVFPGVVAAVAKIETDQSYDITRLSISRQRAYAWGKRR